jgi:hypothetical protein
LGFECVLEAIRFRRNVQVMPMKCSERGAERYGAEVTVQFGRGEFIGDTGAGGGTDRAQRDRARQDMRELSVNPQFREAIKSGQTFGIVGARPVKLAP